MAPSGLRGVHSLPKAAHSCGLISPWSTSPLRQIVDSSVWMSPTWKRCSASNARYFSRQPPTARRDHPDAAPGAVDDLEDVLEHLDRDRVAVRRDRPGIGVLHLGPAFLELVDRAPDALEDVERLEPGDDDGHTEALRERGYSPMPMTVHTCPAARNACTRQSGEVMIASIAGGTRTWLTSRLKFSMPSFFAW